MSKRTRQRRLVTGITTGLFALARRQARAAAKPARPTSLQGSPPRCRVVCETDPAGLVTVTVYTFAYDADGYRLDRLPSLTGLREDTAGKPMNFPATAYTWREHDSDAALQYQRARSFDPAAGRWLSAEPLGFAAGDSNPYRYADNPPSPTPE